MSWLSDLVTHSQGNLNDRVHEALWDRGVSAKQILDFQIGYLNGVLPNVEAPKEFVEWSDGGKKLRDSYVLPLTNPRGEILGVQFRSVDRSNKGYLDYFLRRDEPALFGLGQAVPHMRSTSSVCIVEGAFDLFPVQRVLPFTIGTITAQVTDLLLRWLIRLVTKVYLFYDADSVGRTACRDFTFAHRSKFDHLQSLEYPRGVTLANGKFVKDPADLWEALGDDRLKPHLINQIRE